MVWRPPPLGKGLPTDTTFRGRPNIWCPVTIDTLRIRGLSRRKCPVTIDTRKGHTMKTVDDYCDAARSLHNIKSDRELARTLGLKPTSTNHWRTRRAWPGDAVMIRLADLAGLDPAQALLDLNRWRNDSATVRSVYDRIAHRLAATAAAIGIIAITGVAGSGTAGTGDAAVSHMERATVYYGK